MTDWKDKHDARLIEARRWKKLYMEQKERYRDIGAGYLELRRENTRLREEMRALRLKEYDNGLWERIKDWFRRVL